MRAIGAGIATAERRIDIQIRGCKPIQNVHIERIGRFGFRVITQDAQHSMWCAVHIEMKGAIKHVTLHSSFQVS